MSPPDTAAVGSQRRRETEIRIERAAANAACELGFDNVTIDEICTRAEIARSTYFTYFHSRDAAIVGRRLEILDGEAGTEVLDAHAGNLPLGIFHLIFASLRTQNIDPDVARVRAELVSSQPRARSASTAVLIDSGEQIMAVARDWLVAHPEHAQLPDMPDVEASLASNAAYAGLSALPGGWLAASRELDASAESFSAALADLRVLLGISPPASA